ANSSKGTGSGTKKIVKVTVTFTGCVLSGKKCNSAGAAVGEIKTNELEGQIGYIEPKANQEVGQDLWPSSRTAAEKEKHEFSKERLFAEFACEGSTGNKVWGSVIGKLTPVNTLSKTMTLTYAKGTNAGEQAIKKLEGVEGGVEDVLKSNLFGFFELNSNEQTTQTVTYKEEAEIVA
ncbi:MAG: hypothetical protein JWN81_777, partial [Solirubrobacterales bacterium]|nr:hypothetical protein [Solirubrobacterales bacterium]